MHQPRARGARRPAARLDQVVVGVTAEAGTAVVVEEGPCKVTVPYWQGLRTLAAAASRRARRWKCMSSAMTRESCSTESSSILPTKRAVGSSSSATRYHAAVLQKHENWKPMTILLRLPATYVVAFAKKMSGQSTTAKSGSSALERSVVTYRHETLVI